MGREESKGRMDMGEEKGRSVREEGTWERMWEGSVRVRTRGAGDGVCERGEKELREGMDMRGKRES